MTKFTIILIGVIAIAGSTASLVIQLEAQNRLRENDAVLRQQDNQLAELAAEHQRLSNLVAQANSSPAEDPTAELAKLRSEAETLRKQTNELGTQLAENRRSPRWTAASRPDTRPDYFPGHVGRVAIVSDSDSEEYKNQLENMTYGRLNNLVTLSSAVVDYAREHHDQFPTNFDQAAPQYYKIQAQQDKIHEQLRKLANSAAPPKEVNLRDLVTDKGASDPSALPQQPVPPETSEFEMVYQGSYNELSNVPLQEVALIRERQPWPTPAGKWARIYVAANGDIQLVESDDNFQSWEAEHVIPAPVAGQ